MTGIDENLIKTCARILEALSSRCSIDIQKFKEYGEGAMNLYVVVVGINKALAYVSELSNFSIYFLDFHYFKNEVNIFKIVSWTIYYNTWKTH